MPASSATSDSPVWTVGRLLGWTTEHLRRHGSETPRLDAEVLLAHARECTRIVLYTQYEAAVDEGVRERYRDSVKRRAAGEPVAYLVGHKEFFSLDFEVGLDVLIPRPDTEFVVMQFLALAKEMSAPSVCDVGTGSGNIAVSVARHHAGARVTAVDVSERALATAARNAQRHGVSERISFGCGDLFSAIPAEESFDFILSNPPYIATQELGGLPNGVRDYEPRVALDGGAEGVEVVGRLIEESAGRCRVGGSLVLEIGSAQADAVTGLIGAVGTFEAPELVRDYGGHPRVLWSRRRF